MAKPDDSNFRQLASPLSGHMLRPLGPGVEILQMDRPLAAKDLPRAAAFIAANPDIPLRLYGPDGKGPAWDLAFLADVPGLRGLWLDFTDASLDLSRLEPVTRELQALMLPVTKNAKKNLDMLARFPRLQSLALSGKVADLGFLAALPQLLELRLDRIALADLSALAATPLLEELTLSRGKVGSLEGIESLAKLHTLDIFEVKGLASLAPAARCPALKSLDIRLVDIAAPLDLSAFTGLENLIVIGEPPKLALADVWKAPALRRLELHGYDDQWTERMLRALPAHPTLEPGGMFGWAEDDEGEDGGEADEDAFDERLEAVQARVKKAIQGKCIVEYSAFEEDEDGLPIDNLDDVAWNGRCRLVAKADGRFGDGRDYLGDVIENPTWLQVAVLANAMIGITGDSHHCFLEGIEHIGDEGDVALLEFQMGS